jgi:DNA ligase-1
MSFKPLLASKANPDTLQYPLLASAKLDGIRTLVSPNLGGVVSRNLKPLPNRFVRESIQMEASALNLQYLDGEVLAGSPTDRLAFNNTASSVMSKSSDPVEFVYWVFDWWTHPDIPFEERHNHLTSKLTGAVTKHICLLPQRWINSRQELDRFEQDMVDAGFEGIMVRDPRGPYKFGRSTAKEGILLKIKRFDDLEAEIVGFDEQMHNANEATTNALGYTERSSRQDNKLPKGTLGAIIVKAPGYEETFRVGTGFDDAMRSLIWQDQDKYLGRRVTVVHQPAGAKDKPRFPVFKGFREDL